MHDIDLNLLPVTRVLLEEQSVTRAAERLHLSPSATSRALDRSRRLFQDPLLVPHGRGVAATPAAIELLPRLVQALDGLESLIGDQLSFDASTLRATYVLRASEPVIGIVGSALASSVGAKAPGLTLRFESETAHDVADLAAGRVALGIGSYTDLTHDLATERFTTQRIVGVVREGHPLAGRAKVNAADLAKVEHVVVSRHGRTHGPLDAHLAQSGLTRRIAAVVQSTSVALILVLGSDATTVAPEIFVDAFGRLGGFGTFPLPAPLNSVDVDLVWHGRFTKDPAHQWLRRQVRASAAAVLPAASSNRH